MRNLKIAIVLNGWVVSCGCQTLVFDKCDLMLRKIKEYMENPTVVEKEYLENSINAHIFRNQAPIEPQVLETEDKQGI